MKTIKPAAVQVSFMPKQNSEGIHPPIIAGQRDSIWVTPVKGRNIRTLALIKIRACYGIDAEILD